MSDLEPSNRQQQLELHLPGYTDVKPLNISGSLPRHPTKAYSKRSSFSIKRIVVHTTNWDTTVHKLAKYDVTPYFVLGGKKIYNHISKTGCPAITYHEVIMNDGVVYKTLDQTEIAWHVGIWNSGSLGIALMYIATNPLTGKDEYAPLDKQLRSLQTRCGDLCLQLGITPQNVVGHRELKGTGWFFSKGSKMFRKTCPGMLLDLDVLRKNVALYMQILLKCRGLYEGEIDGDFGPKSKAALKYW